MGAKGSKFERDLCCRLSDWWAEGQSHDDVLFWRTAGSGGRATARHGKGKKTIAAHCGDIAAVSEFGRPLTDLITFELKRGYNKQSGSTIADLFDRPDNPSAKKTRFAEWIDQAKESAERAGSPYWMIIHQRDRRECMCYFRLGLFKKFHYDEWKPCPLLSLTIEQNGSPITVVGMRFSDFLANVHPDKVRYLSAKLCGV